MIFPQAVFASIGCVYAYLLGRKLHSRKFGLIFALVLCFAPWLYIALRFSETYSLLVNLLQLAVLYHYTDFIQHSDKKSARIGAPIALSLYLTTGLEWPLFIPILVLYLLLNKSFKIT